MAKDAIIQLEHLQKQFGNNAVLNDINMAVYPGQTVSIIGASGSGKSTMLRCINRLETPSGGRILFHGQDVQARGFKLADYRARVGMVFQSFNLFNNMTALENCMVGQITVQGVNRQQAKERAMQYLRKVGMEPYIHAKPRQLSGGQKQRVAIARALAMQPEVLLFDEPTSALDPEITGEVLQVIRKLREAQTTMIIVTHEMEFARHVADKVIFMADGVIEEQGTPDEVFGNPQSEKTKAFLSVDKE